MASFSICAKAAVIAKVTNSKSSEFFESNADMKLTHSKRRDYTVGFCNSCFKLFFTIEKPRIIQHFHIVISHSLPSRNMLISNHRIFALVWITPQLTYTWRTF